MTEARPCKGYDSCSGHRNDQRGCLIALDTVAVDACPSFDTHDDGEVTVGEFIQGVDAALTGSAA